MAKENKSTVSGKIKRELAFRHIQISVKYSVGKSRETSMPKTVLPFQYNTANRGLAMRVVCEYKSWWLTCR